MPAEYGHRKDMSVTLSMYRRAYVCACCMWDSSDAYVHNGVFGLSADVFQVLDLDPLNLVDFGQAREHVDDSGCDRGWVLGIPGPGLEATRS